MEFTAGQIADLFQGTVVGDAGMRVAEFAKIEDGQIGDLSFFENPKYIDHLHATRSSVVLVKADFSSEKKLPEGLTLVKVENPRMCFAVLMNQHLAARPKPQGVSPLAYVHESASIGEDVYIAPGAHIGKDVVIGDGVLIHANVAVGESTHIGARTEVKANCSIYHQCVIGADCIFHSGVVIGADGFGFVPNSENNYFKIPHVGNVIIEDHVEIGANSCVDRASLGSTVIRQGVKLDNLIQVGHNCEIGEFTVVAAQTGFGGTTNIGKRTMIGGQVGFAGHLKIADDVKIAAQSGIGQSIDEPGAVVQGSPAFSIRDYKRSYVLFRALPRLKNQLDGLLNSEKEKNT